MKRFLFFHFFIFTFFLVACGHKTKAVENETDSTAVNDSTAVVEQKEAVPAPMFLYYFSPEHMQMVYWTGTEEPKKDKDNAEYYGSIHEEWAFQNGFRTYAGGYTKMLLNDGKLVDIIYKDELLKNPDGEEMYGGELHCRPSIPSPGLRYALVNPKDAPKREYNFAEMFLVLHQDYLKTRKMLKVVGIDDGKPLPQAVVKKMEEKYGMKAERSVGRCKIDGRYTFGAIQFKGEYKNAPKEKGVDYKRALALEVLIDGDKVYASEILGYYDGGFCTWNADDGGEYFPSALLGVFEGPDGLELCFEHGAPESRTVGVMYLRDGKLDRQEYTVYHSLIDEQTPVWKKDIARMRELYREDDSSDDNDYELTKKRLIDLDEDGVDEVWLRAKDDKHGAFFTYKDGKVELIGVEDGRMQPSFFQTKDGKGYFMISGAAGGPSWYSAIYELKNSRVVHTLTVLEVYGEIEECAMDGKDISKEKCRAYMKALPASKEPYLYWNDIEEK
jgi:hypothetical protein